MTTGDTTYRTCGGCGGAYVITGTLRELAEILDAWRCRPCQVRERFRLVAERERENDDTRERGTV